MGSRLEHRFAAYPMVEEAEATGRVARVYADILREHPMVPSVFKSLATCPAYLSLAWDQASSVRQGPLDQAAEELLEHASRSPVPPVPDDEARAVIADFATPLARMAIVVAGLHEGILGRLDGPRAGVRPAPARPSDLEPTIEVPSQFEVDAAALFSDIRHALETPIINSVWRVLAGQELLHHVWDHLRLHTDYARVTGDDLMLHAIFLGRSLPWRAVAGPEAATVAGISDALPGMLAILDAYVKTLPRVLALVATSAAIELHPDPARETVEPNSARQAIA